jgi:hypothetical protein
MNLYEFMSGSPFLTFFLVLVIVVCGASVLEAIAKAWAVRKDPNTQAFAKPPEEDEK